MDASARLIQPVTERDHVEGPAGAPLTLVEYGDYQCPFCGAAHPVLKRLQRALGDKMSLAFRNFPLTEMHPYALAAAEAAEAAALQGRFWEMHDRIFERQNFLEPDVFPVWAEELGLDMRTFAIDVERDSIVQRIKEDRKSGIRSGVNGTPTFFLNGRRHDGPADYDSLLADLESELAAHPGGARRRS
jgi:protein-disulfide isomerase